MNDKNWRDKIPLSCAGIGTTTQDVAFMLNRERGYWENCFKQANELTMKALKAMDEVEELLDKVRELARERGRCSHLGLPYAQVTDQIEAARIAASQALEEQAQCSSEYFAVRRRMLVTAENLAFQEGRGDAIDWSAGQSMQGAVADLTEHETSCPHRADINAECTCDDNGERP